MLVDSPHMIIGTAGHIDHGKTALVKALTGRHVDTLAEEKRRGITIELGFAFMDSPGLDKEIIFIDVPGHEKLIKTMVAGASNLDAALLVVAADEGVSVQTLEHFDILRLLSIETGVIALTKYDLVDDDHIRAAVAEVRDMTAGTFMEDAPVIPVSSVTGQGVAELRSALLDVARRVRKRQDGGVFRMPIDRAFTMQGFGTVIAGTILSGVARVGDRVEILPDGLTARIRGIQVHARSVEQSIIGTRTAINLQDVKKEQLRRGQCACAPGSLAPTNRLDAQFHLLHSYGEDLKNRTRVRLHVGADEVIGRLVLLDCDRMAPGQTAFVQFILESPTTAMPRDRYVIRTFSSMKTIGGGVVLDAQPVAHKRMDASTLAALKRLAGGSEDVVEQAFLKSGVVPLSAAEVSGAIGRGEAEVEEAVGRLVENGRLVSAAQGKYLHSREYERLAAAFMGFIEDYYSRNPYRVFTPVSDLQSRFLKLADRQVYDAIAADLSGRGVLVVRKTRVGLADRQVDWKPGERELARKVEAAFKDAGFSTPAEDDVMRQLGISPVVFANIMTALMDLRRLVRLAERVTYHESCLRSARSLVIKHLGENGSITAAELRDKLGVTRKYAIALLEYFDNVNFTRRLGDKRVLRQQPGG